MERKKSKAKMSKVKLIKAKTYGFCGNGGIFGVSGAIKKARETALTAKKNGQKVYVLGDLVHNHYVVEKLAREDGIKTINSLDEIPRGSIMIIKSHGLPPVVIKSARARGLKLVDATCPMVQAVHNLVKKLTNEGKDIIYLASDLDHEEAVGVRGEAPDKIKLVLVADLENLQIEKPAETVVLTQTTLSILEVSEALEKLQKKYPQLKIEPHICMATTMRQQAVIELAKAVDLLIIVGSPTSSNSNRLREVGEKVGVMAKIVDGPEEIRAEWLRKEVKKIGVSSGASTPDEVLEAVINKIKDLIIAQGREIEIENK